MTIFREIISHCGDDDSTKKYPAEVKTELWGSAIKNTCFPCFYIRWNMGLNTPGAADLLADLSYIDC